ncbi:MAG: PAS domain S-box protein [Candidatus Woesearchaeota archaeon]|jgi:PAS domain S-box-containing protein
MKLKKNNKQNKHNSKSDHLKKYEQAVLKLTKVETALRIASTINKIIVYANNEKKLLEDICRIIVQVGRYKFAYISFVNASLNTPLSPVAEYGIFAGKSRTWQKIPRWSLAFGVPLKLKQPAICRNILHNPNFKLWKSEAEQRGYQSSITIPLISHIYHKEILGVLNIYSADSDAFIKEEVTVLMQIANDISFGISNLRIRTLEKQKEKEIFGFVALKQKYLDISEAIIVELDCYANIKALNKRAYDLLCCKEGTLIGKNWITHFVPVFQKKQVQEVFQALITGKLHMLKHYENKILAKCGTLKDILWHNVPVKDAKGHITGVLSSGIDLTEFKKKEQEIVELKEKYQSLFEHSKDAIMTLSPPYWCFTSGNSMTLQLFNIKSEKQFTHLGPWSLSPKFQPDGQLSSVKAKKMIDIAMKKGSNFFEWKHKQYNGKEFLANVLLSKITENKKTYLQATVRDITEQKKSQEQIKQDEEKFKSLFNNVADAIIIADPKTRKLVDCNNSAESLLGYSREEILSLHADDLHPTDLIKSTMDSFKQQAQGILTNVAAKNGCPAVTARVIVVL